MPDITLTIPDWLVPELRDMLLTGAAKLDSIVAIRAGIVARTGRGRGSALEAQDKRDIATARALRELAAQLPKDRRDA